MEFYIHKMTVYNNNKEIAYVHCGTGLADIIPDNHTDNVNWNNLNEYYKKYDLIAPFNIWNTKKGRRISFFNSSIFNKNTWDIKEWKTDLNLTFKHDYMKDDWVSIEDVLKWRDIDKAIQYLKEHGLSISM